MNKSSSKEIKKVQSVILGLIMVSGGIIFVLPVPVFADNMIPENNPSVLPLLSESTNEIIPSNIQKSNQINQVLDAIKSQKESDIDRSQLATIQIPFITNVGQTDEQVSYYANTFAGTVFVAKGGLTYSIPGADHTDGTDSKMGVAIKEKFVTTKNLEPHGTQKSDSVVNYFVGDEKNWQSGVPTFDVVSLGEVFPGIKVNLKAHGNNVEKIFEVLPDADPSHIMMSFDGIEKLFTDDSGRLLIDTDLGILSMSEPVAYQYVDGSKIHVDVSYFLINSDTYRFEVGNYDSDYTLIIDPLLASTFLGGSSSDDAFAISLDSNDNVFVAGQTQSADFPVTSGAFDEARSGLDVFVSKLSNDLSTLSSSTFLGGSSSDGLRAISLDSNDNVFVAGLTLSADFPVTSGAFDETHNGGDRDVFVSKLSNDLSTLSSSTFLGGSSEDRFPAISLDSNDNVFVAGSTSSADFPVTSGAFDETHNGFGDVFVSKLSNDLTALSSSTFLGGSDGESRPAISLDSNDNVFVAGQTGSADFPVTSGAFDETHNGFGDIFVSKLSNDLTALSSSTFLGGSSSSEVDPAISLDSNDNVFVVGFTNSADFPVTSGAFDETHNGSVGVFVSKLSNDLSALSSSTFLGGSSRDEFSAISLDSNDNVFVAGGTVSADFPVTSGAFDETYNGGFDIFVSKLSNDLTALSSSTFLGGSSDDRFPAISLDSNDNVFVAGHTSSADFPVTSGAFDETRNEGDRDVFVSKLDSGLSGDDKPPTIIVPSDITEEAAGPEGTVVEFTAMATDDVDGTIDPTCTPASGSTFPLGNTTVTCTATDSAGNTVSASFTVIIQDTPFLPSNYIDANVSLANFDLVEDWVWQNTTPLLLLTDYWNPSRGEIMGDEKHRPNWYYRVVVNEEIKQFVVQYIAHWDHQHGVTSHPWDYEPIFLYYSYSGDDFLSSINSDDIKHEYAFHSVWHSHVDLTGASSFYCPLLYPTVQPFDRVSFSLENGLLGCGIGTDAVVESDSGIPDLYFWEDNHGYTHPVFVLGASPELLLMYDRELSEQLAAGNYKPNLIMSTVLSPDINGQAFGHVRTQVGEKTGKQLVDKPASYGYDYLWPSGKNFDDGFRNDHLNLLTDDVIVDWSTRSDNPFRMFPDESLDLVDPWNDSYGPLWYMGNHTQSVGDKFDPADVPGDLINLLLAQIKSVADKFDPADVQRALVNLLLAKLNSPGELRVYDSEDRVTGLVDGVVKEEIPNSVYSEEWEFVVVFDSMDEYYYEVVGTDTGTYSLDISTIVEGDPNSLNLSDLETTSNAVHQYSVDWDTFEEDRQITISIDSDGDGTSETFTNKIPVAILDGPENTEAGRHILFDASDSYDPDGEITRHDWDFGNGNTSTGETAVHVYDSEGTYLVTLTVRDDTGATSTVQALIEVLPADDLHPADMIGDLRSVASSKGVNSNSLNQSVRLLTDNNPNNDAAVCGQLDAFINQVNANRRISAEQKGELVQAANQIKTAIGC